MHKYGWEAGVIAIMGVVIATLAIVTYLVPPRIHVAETPAAILELASPQSRISGSQNENQSGPPAQHLSRDSDSHEVVIGPASIQGRFTLLGVERKRGASASDELTLRLRVDSLAMGDLVTPFESAMLDVRTEGQEPIHPQHAFSHRVAAGGHLDQDVVFKIPSDRSLAHATLRVRYYEEKEIPLEVPPRADKPGGSPISSKTRTKN